MTHKSLIDYIRVKYPDYVIQDAEVPLVFIVETPSDTAPDESDEK